MSGLDNWPHIPETSSAYDNTPEERQAAARIVRGRALSPEDLDELLDAFGLTTTTTKGV